MQTLIATTLKSYGTRQLKPDDEFECSDEHAILLTGLGKAKPLEAPIPSETVEAIKEQWRAAHAGDKVKPSKRKRYNRRDMRPQK